MTTEYRPVIFSKRKGVSTKGNSVSGTGNRDLSQKTVKSLVDRVVEALKVETPRRVLFEFKKTTYPNGTERVDEVRFRSEDGVVHGDLKYYSACWTPEDNDVPGSLNLLLNFDSKKESDKDEYLRLVSALKNAMRVKRIREY